MKKRVLIIFIVLLIVNIIPIKQSGENPEYGDNYFSLYCHILDDGNGLKYMAYSKENDFSYDMNTSVIPYDAGCVIIASGNTPDKKLNSIDFPFKNNKGIKKLSKYNLYGSVKKVYEVDNKWYIEFEVFEWTISSLIQRNSLRHYISPSDYLTIFDYKIGYFVGAIIILVCIFGRRFILLIKRFLKNV